MKIDKDQLRLRHILDSILKIESVTSGLTLKDFLNDWKCQDIVIRNMEIIGEASGHISSKLMDQFPEVEWKKAKGMRNFLIHQYFDINYDEVWATLHNDLPKFKSNIERIMKKL